MHETGSLAVAVLRYSFDVSNWSFEEIKEPDRKIKKSQIFMGSVT
jgi:hypothetical protein